MTENYLEAFFRAAGDFNSPSVQPALQAVSDAMNHYGAQLVEIINRAGRENLPFVLASMRLTMDSVRAHDPHAADAADSLLALPIVSVLTEGKEWRLK